jgi:hypothetical protein
MNELENKLKSLKINKGSNCSKEGIKYEIAIFDILKNCVIINNNDDIIEFNTQSEKELGGCNSKNDIECNWLNKNDIPIEIKKYNTPDWMQCSLIFNNKLNEWQCSNNNKINDNCKLIFAKFIKDKKLFNNKIPIFLTKNISYLDWINIKKNTNDYNDIYFDCPNDTINKLYNLKGCKYIQLSNKGLYYLNDDICNFNVPKFICEQQFRIKVHTTNNNNGFCQLSVTMSCKPKNINNLIKSNYSLDNINILYLF